MREKPNCEVGRCSIATVRKSFKDKTKSKLTENEKNETHLENSPFETKRMEKP